MDSSKEPRPGDEAFDGFRMRLPEDCVDYMLFLMGDKSLTSLEAIRRAAVKMADELTKDYVWQRQAFQLETKIKEGLIYLHGTTNYGDNVEDEWLIVYLLRELSKSFPQLWIRVSDSDGEFLLVEAAKVLPKWLSPENDSNRVWIHEGKLRIIPLQTVAGVAMSKSLSLQNALAIIESAPDTLIHSTFVEAEALYRLEKYPGQITDFMHHSLVTLPRRAAYILHARPKAIAPATEAFYLRDPLTLKPFLSSSQALLFPPRDLVTVSVRFTRVLYAQLKSQRFDPLLAWSSLINAGELEVATGTKEAEQKLARLELGMKITTGLEISARNAEKSDNRVAREVALLLKDLEEDGDSTLPSDDDIRAWKDVERENDDSWMDIDYRDFEQQLDGANGLNKDAAKGAGFGDANTQADLTKIVSRFEAFLNDEGAGIEGAEFDEMDEDDDDSDDSEEGDASEDEDKEVGFDEEQFSRMMREMMGLPEEDTSQNKGNRPADKSDRGDDNVSGSEEDDEDEEIRKLMAQMESELNKHGALSLEQPSNPPPTILAKAGKDKGISAAGEDVEKHLDNEGEDEAVDIDYNLAKNLLESFKSQAGMAGPAGNLLGLMGVSLPRDEGESDEDHV
ncbi:SGT1 protein-domain-containing protein [Lasiosphaeris hirsuta]|uniref:SGT1 protein-domain-containing protein n=1 Tax=Lasiosphaeris hirsuta TaxID=260670 RepID=A0AA40E4I8_9PEZI|nr:SGT1 protein-domain-containing protein [Lasiosphaeris hirsuta]